MKTFSVLSVCIRLSVPALVLTAAVFGGLSCSNNVSGEQSCSRPDVGLAAPALLSPGAGPTELVAYFYKVLLQKDEPTMAQEVSLFGENPDYRNELPLFDQGKDTVPVLIRFCRKHRDWFLPKGKATADRYLSVIMISTPFTFKRTAKEDPGHGQTCDFVIVKFDYNLTSKSHSGREGSVVFPFDNGKISVGGIGPGGFNGDDIGYRVFDITGEFGSRPKD
jgi:hypothetical protein